MAKRSMFVGMDVHKESIDVSLAEEGRALAMSAGPLKGQDLATHRLWKLDERELIARKEEVFSALVDDSNQIVLGGPGVRHNAVDLAENE